MQLAPGERAILSYYSSSEQAEQAVQELKEVGFNSVQVDKIPNFRLFSDDSLKFHALGAMQLDQATETSNGEITLTTRSEAVNWNLPGPLENHTLMITLIVNQHNANQALSIVRKYASIVN